MADLRREELRGRALALPEVRELVTRWGYSPAETALLVEEQLEWMLAAYQGPIPRPPEDRKPPRP